MVFFCILTSFLCSIWCHELWPSLNFTGNFESNDVMKWWSQSTTDQVEELPGVKETLFYKEPVLRRTTLWRSFWRADEHPYPASPVWKVVHVTPQGVHWLMPFCPFPRLPTACTGAGPVLSWLTSGRLLEASSVPSYGQCLHIPPLSGAELDLTSEEIPPLFQAQSSFSWVPTLFRDTEWIRPGSWQEGTTVQ